MKIFVSYSSKDKNIASRIVSKLSKSHDIFFDQQSLQGGQSFWTRIKHEIDRCDIFVFLISEHSTDPASFAQKELRHARRLYSRLTNILVYPIQLPSQDSCDLPRSIANLQYYNLASSSEDAIGKLVTTISKRKTTRSKFLLMVAYIVAFIAALSLGYLGYLQITARHFILYSGQEGSTYNLLGQHLGFALDKRPLTQAKYSITLPPTAGSVENCKQVVANQQKQDTGHSDNSITLALFQLAAHQNSNCSPGSVVYLAPLYDEVTHVIVRKDAFEAFSGKNGDSSLCDLAANNKISMATGLEGSSTRMVADKLLEKCKEKVHKLSPLSFEDALTALKSKKVDLAFYNQAAQSQLIYRAVSDNSACILSLSKSDVDGLQNDLKLERYEPAVESDTFIKLFSEYLCRSDGIVSHTVKDDSKTTSNFGTTPRFQSVSSISVLAIKVDDEKKLYPDVVKSLLKAIYGNKQEDIKKVAPDIFNCEKVNALLKEGEDLERHGRSGNVRMNEMARDYFDKGCPD